MRAMNPESLRLESDEFSLSKKAADLKTLPLSEVLSPTWLEQQKLLICLNRNAFISATTGQDEFVKRILKEQDKTQILAFEMIRSAHLKRKALEQEIPEDMFPLWFVFVQSEGILVNLFETLGFHSDFLYSLGERLPDLVDYCYAHVAHFFLSSKEMQPANQFESVSLSHCH